LRELVKYIVFAIFLAAAIQPAAWARKADLPSSVVLVYTHDLGDDDANGYGPIISGFITAELASEGIKAHEAETRLKLELGDGSVRAVTGALDQLLELGADESYAFIILCAFDDTAGEIDLYFHVLDVAAGEIDVSTENTSRAALLIDSAISRSLDLMLEQVGDRMAIAQTERDEKLSAMKERTSVTVSPAVPATVSNVPARGFAGTAGVGSIVFLGSAADYLRSGLAAAVSGTYGLPFLSGRFDFGVCAAGYFVEPRETITEGTIIISPAGMILGFTSNTGSFLDVSFSLRGGMSIFAAQIEKQPYLTKGVPFVAGGPGFIIFANSPISVQIDVLMNVFFEGKQVIFSYAPNICMLLR
jgi:hypothetical protein